MFDVAAVQRRLNDRGYALAVDGVAGPKTYAALLAFVGQKQVTPMIAALGAGAAKWLGGASINTTIRLRHALAQWAVETGGYGKMEESLNYSAARLMEVWPTRFPTLASAKPYANNPRALAEKTYGGRFGNVHPGDGWLYRGRGPTMQTFHDNYAEAAELTGLDLVERPDQVTDPEIGMRVACAYWQAKGINAAADRDDIEAVRRLVQGGTLGLAEARGYLARARQVLQ